MANIWFCSRIVVRTYHTHASTSAASLGVAMIGTGHRGYDAIYAETVPVSQQWPCAELWSLRVEETNRMLKGLKLV